MSTVENGFYSSKLPIGWNTRDKKFYNISQRKPNYRGLLYKFGLTSECKKSQ